MPIQETNNFIITGIPRSGTSLLCNLVNRIKNIVCFNEITPFYNVDSLPHTFHHMRSELKKGSLVPMKVAKSTGKEITDTQRGFEHQLVDVKIDPGSKLAVGSKINVPYLLQIEKILSLGYKVIFVTRDPVYAIASWNMHKNINEQYVMDEDFVQWPRYSKFSFKSNDRFGRQVELYFQFSKVINAHLDNKNCIRILYEQLCLYTELQLNKTSNFLDMDFDLKEDLPELENLNRDSRFSEMDLDEIRRKL